MGRRAVLVLGLVLGCPQPVVTSADGASAPETGPWSKDADGIDAGGAVDVGASDGPADVGGSDLGDDDGGVPGDGGLPDGGGPRLTPSFVRANVGAPVRLRLEGGSDAARLLPAEVVRRPGLPPFQPSELGHFRVELVGDEVVIDVREVPPWFAETRVLVTVEAAGGRAEAEVLFRGNVVFGRFGRILSADSAGRVLDPPLVDGAGFLRQAGPMVVGRGGTVYVLDVGGSDAQVVRAFEPSGPNVLLRTFESGDANGQPWLRPDQIPQGITQLPDGRVAVGEWAFGEAPPARIVLWNEDGSFDRVLLPRGRRILGALTAAPDGTLLVFDRQERELLRIDADTGDELATWDVGTLVWRSMLAIGGDLLLGGEGQLVRMRLGGAIRPVTGLPPSPGRFAYLARFGEEGALTAGAYAGRWAVLRLVEPPEPWFPSQAGIENAPAGIGYLH